ncbi:MAG: hypothetical protein IJZ08_09245 [Clostridia bacterium]|nr:hypothetical protein [Clostridia bacterium]
MGRGRMKAKYERMLRSGEYMSERELCNALGLNYDDLYEDTKDEDDYSAGGMFGRDKRRR